jgi:hypothetical protein
MTVSVIALSNVNAQTATVPSSTEMAAVDALIPWLLQEDAQLRGIPFSEVIFDSTGKHVLTCNPKDETNTRVLKQMSSVLDEVMARLNAPQSPIQGIPRINEVSSHFEDLIRELLNKTPGLACDFPKTAAGGKQRSGYPDLELVDQLSHRIYISIRNFTQSEVATVHFALFISSRRSRLTKCARTRCISLLALNMRNRRLIGGGNSHVGTWSTFHIFR